MPSVGLSVGEAEVDEMFSQLRDGASGRISYTDFVRMMLRGNAHPSDPAPTLPLRLDALPRSASAGSLTEALRLDQSSKLQLGRCCRSAKQGGARPGMKQDASAPTELGRQESSAPPKLGRHRQAEVEGAGGAQPPPQRSSPASSSALDEPETEPSCAETRLEGEGAAPRVCCYVQCQQTAWQTVSDEI